MPETLNDVLESPELTRLATGFRFTEGPLWHPDGYFYFVDVRTHRLYRIVPGREPVVAREDTNGSNSTTFDLEGRLVLCESDTRRVVRVAGDGGGDVEVLTDRFEGGRFNRPNDVICRSDGSLYFTDPGLRVPLAERELPYAGVYRITSDGDVSLVADCEYPNGLALSPDESRLFVANTRWSQYIHDVALDESGTMVRRRIFADMSHDERPADPQLLHGGIVVSSGAPDGMKVDAAGRVFCTGRGGVWVFDPSSERIGIIETPEVCANVAFGGDDLRTLFLTASTSVYTMRVNTPGNPHPWYARRRPSTR